MASTGCSAFPPSTLSKGGLACFLSHLRIIETTPPDSFTFIFEDDVEFAADLPLTLHAGQLEVFADFDLVLLDCQPRLSLETLAALWHALETRLIDPEDLEAFDAPRRITGASSFDARTLYAWGISSYLVTPKGHRTLPPLMRECLDRGPPGQWDILARDASADGRIRVAALAPFLATPLLESYADTTIDNRVQAADKLGLASAIRRMFFAGPISGVEALAQTLLDPAVPQDTPRRLMSQLLARVFEIVATGDPFVLPT
jgi:hypothetical protein